MYNKKPRLRDELKTRLRQFAFDVLRTALNLFFGKTKRRWVVGFGPVEIPPRETVTIQAQPQCFFRGEKIVNTGNIDLQIQGLFIGQKSQLPTFQNPISMATFAGSILDNEVHLDLCDPALFITWQIHNPTDEKKTFGVSIVGWSFMSPQPGDFIG